MIFRDNATYITRSGQHDRIQIHMLNIHLIGQESDLTAFFGVLSHQSATSNDEGDTTPYFGSPQRYFSFAEVSFSSRISSNRPVVGAPLIDGKYIFKRASPPTLTEREDHEEWDEPQSGEIGPEVQGPQYGSNLIRFIGHAEIALNPTRAFVHQSHTRRNIRTGQVTSPEISLYTREQPPFEEERPINPMDDNVIIRPEQRRSQRTGRYGSFQNFTDQYVRTALETVENHLVQARDDVNQPDDGAHVFMRLSRTINVKQVETYWSLPSPAPFDDLMQIEPRFRALGANSQRRIYANVVADLETEQNVPSIATRIAPGLRAKLYPKTNRSLRFELTHDLRHCNAVGTQHTFTGENAFEDVIILLERCRTHAGEQAQILAGHLAADENNEQHQTPYELVAQIVTSCDTRRQRELLIEILIHNGRFTNVPNDEFRSAIRKLVHRGVVERVVRNGRTVRLTSEYEQARQILANHAPVNLNESAS